MTLSFAVIPLSIIIKEFLVFPSQLLPSGKGRAPGRREKERDVHPDEVASKFYYTSRFCGFYCFLGITGPLERVKEIRLGEPHVERLVPSG